MTPSFTISAHGAGLTTGSRDTTPLYAYLYDEANKPDRHSNVTSPATYQISIISKLVTQTMPLMVGKTFHCFMCGLSCLIVFLNFLFLWFKRTFGIDEGQVAPTFFKSLTSSNITSRKSRDRIFEELLSTGVPMFYYHTLWRKWYWRHKLIWCIIRPRLHTFENLLRLKLRYLEYFSKYIYGSVCFNLSNATLRDWRQTFFYLSIYIYVLNKIIELQ